MHKTFILNELPILKIYFDISQLNLSLASGTFTYTADDGNIFDLPIIYMPDGIMILNLTEGQQYTGELKLDFATGETLKQKIGFALMPWLNEFSLIFAPELTLVPAAFNAPNLGYGKFVDADSLQETYNIPTTKNIDKISDSTWAIYCLC